MKDGWKEVYIQEGDGWGEREMRRSTQIKKPVLPPVQEHDSCGMRPSPPTRSRRRSRPS